MLEDKICGTYWLCRNKDSSLWLLQHKEAPYKNGREGYRYDGNAIMTWLHIGENSNDYTCREGVKLSSRDFDCILSKLPKVTYEDGPIEIEICKSGRVYYYES